MKCYKGKPHIAIEYTETRYIIRKYWIFRVPQKLLFFWEEFFGGMVTLLFVVHGLLNNNEEIVI